MSAQVTEAHRELARRIMFEFTQAGTATASDVRMAAQIIADSEAKATERANAQVESLISSAKNAIPASEHPAEPTVENWAWQIRNLGDDRRLVCAERDQLRAELQRLDHEKPWLTETRLTAIAQRMRAEKAEGDCLNLRADLDAIKAIRNEEKARAERAEAELAACKESLHLADGTANLALVHRDAAEAELATERARLDWLMAGGVCMVQHAGGFHVSRLHAPVSRAHIDAAMKEEAK